MPTTTWKYGPTRGWAKFVYRWSPTPEGPVLDPTPEPGGYRYLVLGVEVFGFRLVVSLDMAS